MSRQLLDGLLRCSVLMIASSTKQPCALVKPHRAPSKVVHLSCSYLKVSTVNSKKTLELAVRCWNSGPNLLCKKPEKSTDAENIQNLCLYMNQYCKILKEATKVILRLVNNECSRLTDLRWDRSIVRDSMMRMKEMTRVRDTMSMSSSGGGTE